MTQINPENPKIAQETEVDFINLARTFWEGRVLIGKLMLTSLVIGFFIAIVIPNEFTASSTMVPQISDPKSKLAGLSGGLSGLSGLAAMAGINLNTTTGSELSPKMYSSIITSVPFQLELMKMRLNFEKLDSSVTLYDYYVKIKYGNPLLKYTVGLPSMIIRAIKGEKKNKFTSNANPYYMLTEKQIEVSKILEQQIGVFFNEKDGYVSLSCSLPEAYASAQLTQQTQLLLQRYITEFKIEKVKLEEDFIQQRFDEAKKNYLTAQQNLAAFRDRNKNMNTATAKTEEERLYGEYTLVTGVYSELAKKLEQAKIQVKEETPVFTIIRPASVPVEKDSPNRPLILAIAAFIGFVLGTVVVLGKTFMTQVRNQWLKVNVQ
jgi:G-rich domain on putative tyrosine kinase